MDKKTLLRNFCFTINNPDASIRASLLGDDRFSYIVMGDEIGESKTPHIQGYAELKKRTRFPTIKRLMPTAHIERRRGRADQAAEYCKKDGIFCEAGTISRPGKRSDITLMRQLVDEGKSFSEIMLSSDAAIRYPRALRTLLKIHATKHRPSMDFTPRPWQEVALAILEDAPSQRQIHWFWDRTGATGKTTLCRYLVTAKKAFYAQGGKTSDIAHGLMTHMETQSILPTSNMIILFDFCRTQQEHVNYNALEALKNGMLFSAKYDSQFITFNIPYVFVFSNFEPEREKLSQDRWDVHNLSLSNYAFAQ